MSENNINKSTDLNLGKENKRKKLLISFFGTIGIIGAGIAAYWIMYSSNFVSTDNAYSAVEIAQVTPSIGGTISEVLVTDTQMVKKGDILVTIDQTDTKLALDYAEANLSSAIRKVKGLIANNDSLNALIEVKKADEIRINAQLNSAKADFERASIDLQRREALVSSGAISGDELTNAKNVYSNAKANLDSAKAAIDQAKAALNSAIGAKDANEVLIAGVDEDQNPEILATKARYEQAKVDFERTLIKAPIDGIVAKRQVQLGQKVQSGMPLLAIVPIQDIHVDANFKEVQLEKVRVGQPVKLHADIYGKSVIYHGVVEGFSGGSGSAFSAIPAQNATGNWIKVVQRLPVRIALNQEELKKHPLKVGLSMNVEIDTRVKN
ncbi:HlyD family secretion protein [Aliarcobacter cryaerophilus]|uniref:HlyD family secretion protein n=1 Tax=Aliarcobacter cryaerophilus TaxID=28198 RepID=UPI0021B675DF|nr:HlyD family secretion protein [Aliarcobacter cryaerophilus]MCT7489266.1 HlyD family secretion protein [Aliarcobacter cryaerophilus]